MAADRPGVADPVAVAQPLPVGDPGASVETAGKLDAAWEPTRGASSERATTYGLARAGHWAKMVTAQILKEPAPGVRAPEVAVLPRARPAAREGALGPVAADRAQDQSPGERRIETVLKVDRRPRDQKVRVRVGTVATRRPGRGAHVPNPVVHVAPEVRLTASTSEKVIAESVVPVRAVTVAPARQSVGPTPVVQVLASVVPARAVTAALVRQSVGHQRVSVVTG